MLRNRFSLMFNAYVIIEMMGTSFFGLLLCFYSLVAEVVFVLISWFLSLTLLADKGGYI